MGYKVDNAVILAAGTSSRFAPLSYEKPKALISVKGEVLVERQIRQLKEAGINEIILVVGYKKEQFYYLKDKYNITIIENKDYNTRNNNASIYAVRDFLKNTYICSADNYFEINPFEKEVEDSYYATLYSEEKTNEWCVKTDEAGYIDQVSIGGEKSWYMLGHVFWNEKFSQAFKRILIEEYNEPETANLLWESIYMKHLHELKLTIKKYGNDEIFEFDSLDELREFDHKYIESSGSEILSQIAEKMHCNEKEIVKIAALKMPGGMEAIGFEFHIGNSQYKYMYKEKTWRKVK